MANNFRYTAADNRVFCSQEYGSDANDGLTPDTPKKTLAGVRAIATSTRNTVILSGHFLNEIFGSFGTGVSAVIGDGTAIIEYPNNTSYIIAGTVASFSNIVFKNIAKLVDTANFVPQFVNCELKNIADVGNGTTFFYGYVNCLIYNSVLYLNNAAFALPSYGNKFINCYVKGPSGLTAANFYRNYMNKATLFELIAVTDGRIGAYNNYECKFKYTTIYYDTLTDLVTAYSVLNDTEGNRSDTVTFNGAQYGDYSVPSDSPLLITSRWNSNICANSIEGLGIYWINGTTNWTISQTTGTDDLEVVTGTLQLVSGKTIGSITRNSTSEIAIGALKTLKYFKFLGNRSFNAGTGINAPAINVYTAGQAGRLPVRLTVDIKYSPITRTQGEWDAMPWWTMDISSELKTDGTYGTGSPEYDFNLPAHLGGIKGGFCLIKITLRSVL